MDYKIINYIITFYCWSRYTGPYSWWTKTRTVWGTHPVCCTTCNSLPIRNLLGTTVPFFYLSIKKGKGAYSSLWNSPQNYVSRTWVSCCRKSNKTIQSKHPTWVQLADVKWLSQHSMECRCMVQSATTCHFGIMPTSFFNLLKDLPFHMFLSTTASLFIHMLSK